MTKDTWPTLCRLHYVNVSLDAGSKKYVSLKGRSSVATTPTFEQVIDNIRGLSEERRRQRSDLTIQPRPNLNNITVSYVVVPDNCKEIAEVVSKTENAGADAIRFKCDIGGKYPLGESIRRQAFAALREAQHPDARRDPPSSFRVTVIHDEADVAHETYRSWRKQYGCYYHLFATTIGSDGQVYLCDHNAIRGAQPLGDAVRGTLASVWAGSQRQAVVGNIAQTCCSSVCPPFGNAVNLFLRKVEDLAGVHGTSDVLGALRLLHGKLGSQTADAGASGCRPEGE
jgi:sulfatase maturation enzyme AslB (radical SAM superfamily)